MKKSISELNIRGAIFDMDGVILDSMPFWRNFPYLYLESLGITPPADLIRDLYEMGLEEGIIYLKNRFNVNKTNAEIIEGSMALVSSFYADKVQLKPGVIATLQKLKSMGIPIMLATASPRNQAEDAFTRLGIIDYFDKLFVSAEVGSSKHDPEIYNLAAAELGSKPDETLVFEDTLYALQTAASAGFVTIGLYDNVSAFCQDELKASASYYLTSLEDFDTLL